LATSGTVSTTAFNSRALVDRAFGRCKLAPQQITPEYIRIAQDLLYLLLSALANDNIPLWCQQKTILAMYDSVQDITLDPSVVDILNANLRTSTRLLGTYSASQGVAANAFDGLLNTACTQIAANGNIQINFGSANQPVIWGFLPNVSGTWNFQFQTSPDGITWTTIYTGTSVAVTAGVWFWTDIEGLPETGFQYARLLATGGTVLDVRELVMESAPSEVPLAKINRDDYANLPNKFFQGRPVQYWFDKILPNPLMVLWPSPQLQFTFNQIVVYVKRYIQDVGTLPQQIEVPQRWLLAITVELARQLSLEIPEVQGEVIQSLAIEAPLQLARAQKSESDGSPTQIMPNISPYTR